MTMTTEDMQNSIEQYCNGKTIAGATFEYWGDLDMPFVELRFDDGTPSLMTFRTAGIAAARK